MEKPHPYQFFYADKISLLNWEPPHNNLPITEDEKSQIISFIETESTKNKLPIVFE